MTLRTGLLGLLAAAALGAPRALEAQHAMHPRWEIPGFDFSKDGVWRVRARQVAETRRALLRQGRIADLNASVQRAAPLPSATAVTGALGVPFVLLSYPGIDSLQFMRDTSQYVALLFGASAPAGLPYSLNSFYTELSNGLFGMAGRVSPWARLAQSEVNYTGTPGTACASNPYGTSNCNGIFSTQAISQLHAGMREALGMVDGTVDFSQFDNDGPDGIPNSDDDDGFVDLVLFGHATRDGACGGSANNHVWSHKFSLANTSPGAYTTNDARHPSQGGFIRVTNYLVQSALGGATGCDTTNIMPIGTAAHELGHGIGLPDLYDYTGTTFGSTEGIGQWGLMGTGNFTSPRSPSRMESWSLNELGWITLAPLTTSGTYTLGPAPLSDTAFIVGVQGTNTRGEVFLLENRQATLADTALIRIHCIWSGNPPGCRGGLLIWHVDSAKVTAGFANNTVNNGPIHGLALEQADAFGNLDANSANRCAVGTPVNGCSNRGDAGDVFPGTANNFAFVYRTNPAARKNLDSSFAGFAVDEFEHLSGQAMSFRVRFGDLTVVRASDTAAVIQFQSINYNVFRDLLEDGTSYTVSVADTQLAPGGLLRWRFSSWSDGGAREHPITGDVTGGTLIANLIRDHKLVATAATGGSISSSPSVPDLSNAFLQEGSTIELTATPDAGEVFGGWAGDTTSSDPSITLTMNRAYSVVACFGAVAITSASERPAAVMGASYADTLRVSCGSGSGWAITAGALPQGLTLSSTTGRITGVPRETGEFAFTASVTAGGETLTKALTLAVTAPVLTTADVVAQLLGPTAPLNAEQLRYLDLLGNNNGTFDVGDFLAWVKATGAP